VTIELERCDWNEEMGPEVMMAFFSSSSIESVGFLELDSDGGLHS
jgi:hypothetical protein